MSTRSYLAEIESQPTSYMIKVATHYQVTKCFYLNDKFTSGWKIETGP